MSQLADARLGPLAQPLADNATQLADALRAVDELTRVLLITSERSNLEVGAVLDEVWNALGRPARSPDYAAIAGSGITAWTKANPARQHHLLRVLASNLQLATHPELQPRKQEWATRIETCAAAQQEAAGPLEAAEALAQVLRNQRRTLANHAQVALTRLKRDLKNAGLTEVQIHEIIPSHARSNKPAPTPAAGPAPTPAPAPAPAPTA